jgi:NADPH:quinone reductase-like Zn-dependent oxidoreductase
MTRQRTNTATAAVTTMRAVVRDQYGAPADVLRLDDVAQPEIGADEVLVRVRAAGVDRGVWHVLTGLPYPIRLAGFGFRAPRTLSSEPTSPAS